MNTIKDYIAYIKDNPEGYWFKRKLYGWGWTPATREGWLVMFAFIIFLLWSTLSVTAIPEPTFNDILRFYGKISIGIVLLLVICWKKGERPKWQWGIPKEKKG